MGQPALQRLLWPFIGRPRFAYSLVFMQRNLQHNARLIALLAATWVLPGAVLARSDANPAGIDWQVLGPVAIARTETTVAQFRRYADATRLITHAERAGGGQTFESGWTQKPGWTWRAPLGKPAGDEEPAVHITWTEAQAFCRWAGGRLPSDADWVRAAYTEQREQPAPRFVRGKTYLYPSGDSPAAMA